MAGNESSVIYLTALVMSVMIFAAGVATGIFLLQIRNRNIENDIKELSIRSADMSLQLNLMESFPNCNTFNEILKSTLEDMGEIESKLSRIENSNQLNRYEIKQLRENYQLLSLRYLLLIQKFPECIKNRTIIVYFYRDKCDLCENQGIILSHLKEKYDDGLLVFPFDHSLNLSSIRILESQYNISSYPALVVNGNVHGYMTKRELEEAING